MEKNDIQSEHKKKLMEKIKRYYNQIKFGCYRELCYNKYCLKSKGIFAFKLELNLITETDILTLAINLGKKEFDNFCLDLNDGTHIIQFDQNLNNFEIVGKFESLCLNFYSKDFKMFNNVISLYESGLNYDYCRLKAFFTKTMEMHYKLDEIQMTLRFLNSIQILKIFESKNEESTNLKIYLFYLLSRLLIYISVHPFFGFEGYYAKDHIEKFFDLYLSVVRIMKSCKIDFLSIFKDMNKDLMIDIVNAYQCFISIFFMMENNKTAFVKIKNPIKIFNIFYKINYKFRIVPYTEFYNEAINNNEDLKYLIIKISKSNKKNQKLFNLLKYSWLFDSAFKRDVLSELNAIRQKQEMINSITSGINTFDNIFNLENNIYLSFDIRRENIIEDTLNIISNSKINFNKPLKVKFVGEQGIDQGGVKKEYFLLLIRQLFDVGYGMFNYYENTRIFWFNQYSFEASMKFELIGIILGLAIFNNVILDVKFPKVVYKKLLGISPDLEDIKDFDVEHYNSFIYLINCKDDEQINQLQVTFSIVVENFGHKETINLKENGENIFVSNKNKLEYINLYIDWFFNKSIQNIFKSFKFGFNRVCDESGLKMIRPEELELIICGSEEMDFYELQKAAKFEDGYTKDSITMKFLWEVLHEMTKEDQKKFIFFTTGCDRAPINGLGNLTISISRGGPDSDKLPSAHTCFNHLIIPDYQNKEKLRNRLILAIQNAEGFGLM